MPNIVTSSVAMEVNHGPRPPYPSGETVVDLLRRHAERTPSAVALVLPEGEHQEGTGHRLAIDYDAMFLSVESVASQLLGAAAVAATRDNGAIPPTKWVMLVLPQGTYAFSFSRLVSLL